MSLKPRNSSRICISDPVTKEDFDMAVKLLEYPPKKVAIDDAIQTIEEGIAKLERLKKGAMENFLPKVTYLLYNSISHGINDDNSAIVPLIGEEELFVISKERFRGYLTYSHRIGRPHQYIIFEALSKIDRIDVPEIDELLMFGNSVLEFLQDIGSNEFGRNSSLKKKYLE
ncbi:MAG: hypothetical protein J7J05_00710, partial [Thermococcus sp.]|uniref:hypothetical protein n=1 Tax=Thermococcus sp. TaxID=35749 RepID=UPI00261C9BCD